ncbi:glutathione s-transferase omega 2 [Fusarium austroafricanum]|uniref:Glutathione s-transferase omega 2 n=1 Tax=Fusarium austroafricanum TaxID=2364996 RepID=A0A8H4KC11_9HYPO|nr:glutathione s-transferase omega 2 [Fusarium austroafricanum]
MAPDTFPQFVKLPKEIQILIWEAAVRPVPGDRHVHRFFIADYHLNQPHPSHNIPGRFLHLLRTRAFKYASLNVESGFSLAIPADDKDGNPNDSVYLTDSSLWTVCKESRQAMERRFEKNEWWSHVKSPFHPKRTATWGHYVGEEGAAHTASYRGDDGVVKHITINHDKDLVHLDPRFLNDVDWWHLRTTVFVPLFDHRDSLDPGIEPSFIGDNIALDYDRSIIDTLEGRVRHYTQKYLQMYSGQFVDMISLLYDVAKRTIWFIDYGLVRATQISTNTLQGNVGKIEGEPNVLSTREVFRSSDFIYTEVKREDVGLLWHISDDEVNNGATETAFDMFDVLRPRFGDYLGIENFDRLRVLACQPAPGRTLPPKTPWARRCGSDPSCEICGFKEAAPPVRPSTMKRQGSESSTDISMSDLNLFD